MHLVCMNMTISYKWNLNIGIETNDQARCEENENVQHRHPLEQLSDRIDRLEIVLKKLFFIRYFSREIHVLSI